LRYTTCALRTKGTQARKSAKLSVNGYRSVIKARSYCAAVKKLPESADYIECTDKVAPFLPPKDKLPSVQVPSNVPESLNIAESLLKDNLRDPVTGTKKMRNYSNKALIYDFQNYSYHDMIAEVARYANTIKTYGLARGESILVCIPDSTELIFMLLGILKCGLVPVPIYGYSIEKIKQAQSDTNARVLLIEETKIHRDLYDIDNFEVSSINLHREPGIFNTTLDNVKSYGRPAPTNSNELAFLLPCSQSSAQSQVSKFVSHPHYQLKAAGEQLVQNFKIEDTDVVMLDVPVTSSDGLNLIAAFFNAGATVVLPYEKTARGYKSSTANTLAVTSDTLESLYEWDKTQAGTLKDVLSTYKRVIVTGKGAVEARQKLVDAVPGCPPVLISMASRDLGVNVLMSDPTAPEKLKAGPGVELRVVEKDGTKDVAAGAEGRLVAKGPTGAVFWNSHEEQQSRLVDGWTGIEGVYKMQDDQVHIVSQ